MMRTQQIIINPYSSNLIVEEEVIEGALETVILIIKEVIIVGVEVSREAELAWITNNSNLYSSITETMEGAEVVDAATNEVIITFTEQISMIHTRVVVTETAEATTISTRHRSDRMTNTGRPKVGTNIKNSEIICNT